MVDNRDITNNLNNLYNNINRSYVLDGDRGLPAEKGLRLNNYTDLIHFRSDTNYPHEKSNQLDIATYQGCFGKENSQPSRLPEPTINCSSRENIESSRFNYAIDRHKIADFTIQGEGTSADYGMVPYTEAFEKEGYPYKKLRGYTFDPTKAKELLKAAGYADGKGFPEITLEINSGGGDRNILIAEVVKSMLEENLKVKVSINTVPSPKFLILLK
jgi:ABC-type transport system substrate-binding protein